MTDEDLKRLFETFRQDNANAHDDTNRKFDAAVQRMESSNTETRRHFDVAVEREKRFDLSAEQVSTVNSGLQQTRVALDENIERTAAESRR